MPLGPWSIHEETTAILRGRVPARFPLGEGKWEGAEWEEREPTCELLPIFFPRVGLGLLSRTRSREKRKGRLR